MRLALVLCGIGVLAAALGVMWYFVMPGHIKRAAEAPAAAPSIAVLPFLNLRSIAEKLDVAHLLEGSVRKEGNSVRVTAQLIEAAHCSHLWSQTYDRELKTSSRSRTSCAIVKALRPKLVQDAALVQQATANTEAHDLYLKGRFFWNQRTSEGPAKAATLFE